MARIMAQTVVLRDPASDAPVALLAGQECPEWAEKVITNDEVLEAEADKPKRRTATATKSK